MYYDFVFSDGSSLFGRSKNYALNHALKQGIEIVDWVHVPGSPGIRIGNKPAKVKDGFQSGYHPALGCHVRGRKHYEKLLNERGLTEVGNEPLSMEGDKKQKPIFTEKMVRELVNTKGAEISGNEADALKKGVDLSKK